jgi:hypothetical protein
MQIALFCYYEVSESNWISMKALLQATCLENIKGYLEGVYSFCVVFLLYTAVKATGSSITKLTRPERIDQNHI